ncbi:MAG: chemotaxis protein [Candidatus Liberibacter europaeus]|uniref:Chemotaxis protein n=1 Tax=Candidatus Liberibacter europaeus TaxID=744859 RepID=A0A2T4VX33_9HYPH|nr:chemotaxis protein [Candidatus Liberibacter europaeus]PTL86331.1 MAG: chemotaxis protein [Candidatus Liberibacter europaeus]
MSNNKQNREDNNKPFKELTDNLAMKSRKNRDNYRFNNKSERNENKNTSPIEDVKSSNAESNNMEYPNRKKDFKQDSSTEQFYSEFSPANDFSGGSIVNLLQNIGKNSLKMAMRNALIASMIWFLCGLGFAITSYVNSSMNSFYGFVARPETMILFLAMNIIPVLLFFAFFIMISRARDMHEASQSIAEVALRLMEPETYASDRILSVGNTVRKEILTMTEGIESAISRANDLESVVRFEVDTLERNYSKDETRIKNIVQQLKEEREAIFEHGTQLRKSMSEVHKSLKEELSLTSEEVSIHLSNATESFSSIINSRIIKLTDSINQSLNNSTDAISTKIDQLLEVLDSTSITITEDFDDRIKFLSKSLDNSSNNLLNQLNTHISTITSSSDKLNLAVKDQSQHFIQTLKSHIYEVSDFFSDKQETITTTLKNTMLTLRTSFQVQEGDFHNNLKSRTENTFLEISNRTNMLENKIGKFIEKTSEDLGKSIAEFSAFFDNNFNTFKLQLEDNIEKVRGCLSNSHDNMEELFVSNIKAIDSNLDNKTLVLADTLAAKQENMLNIADDNVEKLENILTNGINNLTTVLEDKSQIIDSDIKKISEEICSSFTSSCQKMSNLIATREESFSNSLIQAQLQFEETLANRPQSIISSMSESISKLTDTVYDKTMVLAVALSESQKALDGTLKSHTQEVVDKITDARSKLENCFSESSGNVVFCYNNNNKKLDELLKQHLIFLEKILESKREQVSNIFKYSAENIDNLLSDNTKLMKETFSNGSTDIKLELSTVNNNISNYIGNIKTISTTLEQKCNELGADLINHSNQIVSSFETAQESLNDTFSQRKENFVSDLSENQTKFENNLKTQSQFIVQSISNDIKQLTEVAYEKAKDLANSLSESQKTLGVILEDHSQNVLENISNADDNINKSFENRMDSISLSYSKNHQLLDKKLSDHIEVLQEVLKGNGDKIDNAIDSASKFIKSLLNENSLRIENLLSSGNDSVNSTLLRAHRQFDQLLKEKSDDIAQVIDDRSSSISMSVVEKTTMLQNILKEKEVSLAKIFDSSAKSLEGLSYNIQTLFQELVSLVGNTSQSTTDISERLEKSIGDVNSKIQACKEFFGENVTVFAGDISKVMEDAEQKISQRTREISQQLLKNSDVVTDQIVDNTSRISGEISNITNKFIETGRFLEQKEEKFRCTLDHFNDSLSEVLGEVDQAVSARTNETHLSIEKRIQDIRGIISNLDEVLESHGISMLEQFKEYLRCFESNITTVNSLLDNNNKSMQLSLDERSNTLDNLLSQRSVQISDAIVGAFHKEESNIVKTIDEKICDAANSIEKLEESLVTNVEKIADQISDSSTNVKMIINTATNSLSKVDDRLHNTTNRIAETTGKIDMIFGKSSKLFENKIKDLNKISELVLLHMSEFVNKLDKNSQILLKSHDSLVKTQVETGIVLDKRASGLTDLTNNLIIKSSDAQKFVVSILTDIKDALEKVDFLSEKIVNNVKHGLKSSFVDIEGTMSKIELRSRDSIKTVNSDLVSIGDNTIKTIDQNFKMIEGKALDLSKHMIQTIFSSLPNIENTISDLERKSDKSIQKFLDSLSYKIDVLIRKLSDTSNAITVNSNQITEELNTSRDILKRDSINLAKEAIEVAETMRKAVEEQNNALIDFKKIVDDSTPRRSNYYQENPVDGKLDQSQSDQILNNDVSVNEWLEDIFNPSNSNEKELNSLDQNIDTLSVPTSIKSLVMEVDQFIDYNEFIDLWQSYTQGKSDIFSNRLYTIKGQKVFNTIQDKYTNDINFRHDVDNYISSFEKMLAESSAYSPDSSVVQDHITSNYGKTYTILVHASGRTL